MADASEGKLDLVIDVGEMSKTEQDRDKMMNAVLGARLESVHNATGPWFAYQDAAGIYHETDKISPDYTFASDDLWGALFGNPVAQFLFGFFMSGDYSRQTREKIYETRGRAKNNADEIFKIKMAIKEADENGKENMEKVQGAQAKKNKQIAFYKRNGEISPLESYHKLKELGDLEGAKEFFEAAKAEYMGHKTEMKGVNYGEVIEAMNERFETVNERFDAQDEKYAKMVDGINKLPQYLAQYLAKA